MTRSCGRRRRTPTPPSRSSPSSQPTGATGGATGSGDYEELAELVRQVMTRGELPRAAGPPGLAAPPGGMPAGKAVETLQGLHAGAAEPHDERWQARFDEIERTVESAAEKQGGPDQPAGHPRLDRVRSTGRRFIAKDGRIFSEVTGQG